MAKKKTSKKKSVKKTRVTSRYSGMSIEALLKELAKASDPIEKRKIRAMLRKLGHKGGLNKKTTKSKKSKKSKKKKTSKKS